MTTGGPTRRSSRPPAAAARTARSEPARMRSAATVGMDGRGRVATGRGLDHDALRPRQPVGDLLGQGVVAGDEADRHAPRPEDHRVEAVLAGRAAVQARLDRRASNRYGRWFPRGWPGPRVVADEERDIEPRVRSRTLDHRPRLLALQDARGRMDRHRQEVEHAAVAVVDEDVLGAAASDCPSIAALVSPTIRSTAAG